MAASKSFLYLMLLTILYASLEPITVYVAGATWCVANPKAPVDNQQKDIDVLCDATDCSSIKPGGACFEPNTVRDHASVVFNRYYKERDSNPSTCNFGGDAMVTSTNPSHGSCLFQ